MNDEPDHSIIDVQQALRYTAGDRSMLVVIAEAFLDEGPKQLQTLRDAVEQSNMSSTSKAAHTLKSSIVIFGAESAKQLVMLVEGAADDGDAPKVGAAMIDLEHEMNRLMDAVKLLAAE